MKSGNITPEDGILPTVRAWYRPLWFQHSILGSMEYEGTFREWHGMTPLHEAAVNGHLKIIEYLLTFVDVDINGFRWDFSSNDFFP